MRLFMRVDDDEDMKLQRTNVAKMRQPIDEALETLMILIK